MKPIRVVFDTNCYFAAASQPNGHMAGWMDKILSNEPFKLFVSPEILDELQRKLETKLGYGAEQSVAFRLFVQRLATVVYPTVRLDVVRDKDDDKILECAVAAKANLVISLDKDLLTLKEYGGIKMAHPSMLKYWFL